MDSYQHQVYKIKGDQTDSSIGWKDQRNGLLRTNQITTLVSGAINSPIVWDLERTMRRDQSQGVAKSLTTLIAMAGNDDIRAHLRLVEDNGIPLPGGNPGDLHDLIEDVDKIRYIITYYNDLTKPNDVKDSDLLKKREAIKYESTGKTNLTKDVTSYFQQIINIELEMQDHVKLSSYLKIQMCSRTLTRAIPSLASPISSLPLTTAAYTFDNFRTDVLKLCNQLHVTEAHHHFDSYACNFSTG